MQGILLKAKVQTIFFETKQGDLGTTHATSDKRITQAEAEDILLDREIEYKEVLKVKYQTLDLLLPLADLENYIICIKGERMK